MNKVQAIVQTLKTQVLEILVHKTQEIAVQEAHLIQEPLIHKATPAIQLETAISF